MESEYSFDVTFTGRHEEVHQDVKESVLKQILKLSRFYSHIIDGNVIIDRSNSIVKVEVLLRVPGMTITAKHEDYKQNIAIDGAIDRAKTQLKKLKSKVVDHRVSVQPIPEEVTEAEDEEEPTID
ncbi:ribosome hibernation-promoting factor, HPF/YfiA family [Candidatus Latescibacterota bacterium]